MPRTQKSDENCLQEYIYIYISIVGLYCDNGKEHGNYYILYRVI